MEPESILTLVSESTSEPLTVAEAKTYMRMESTDSTAEDTLIGNFITIARKRAEHLTGRAIVTKTWQLFIDKFANSTAVIELPRPPISTASSNVVITYVQDTTAGTTTTIASTVYTVDAASVPGRLYPAYDSEWPTSSIRGQRHAVTIQFVSGYSTANLPAEILQWMRMRVLDMYENRESASPVQLINAPRTFVDGLLDEYTIPEIAT